MSLSTKEKQQLKAKAHHLKPVIMIGNNGLTEAVHKEINRALDDHELIKIKIAGSDRETKKQILTDICLTNNAELVHTIGNIGIIYRQKEHD